MSTATGGGDSSSIAIVLAPSDPLAAEPPVRWAVGHLTDILAGAGVTVRTDADSEADLVINIGSAGDGGQLAGPEAFELSRPDGADGAVRVAGADPRGLAYGVLELADRARYSDDVLAELRATTPETQQAATPVRSILRTFTSDVEDKPWFYDREFWSEYLTELAVNRVNRFQLAVGMQYNYGHHPATDNYFCFPYPFLLDVPGFDVRAGNVPDDERDRNLETLRFISDETKRRGMHFQLGLWNHAFDQGEGSAPLYPVTGVTPENHATYSAAALNLLLNECPSIDGLTMRVHYEGGIPEPNHEEFWQTVMTAVGEVGRPIELDMHAKGVDQELVDIAQGTGLPVIVSAKHWAEHQGLPYHQTTIRERERATKEAGSGLMAITAFQRRFTRYGYGDFLREGSDLGLLFRIWPGTQKVLLWGDPELAAGYGRLGTFAGACGIELCEPLTFKGRKNTGDENGRDPYADKALHMGRDIWKKYLYTYRLWGRLLYNPDAPPDEWRRFLRAEYGNAANAVEQALAPASRVLPLVTVVHGLGASNNGYWPEIYLNMPIAGGPNADHYERDTAKPPTFGGVSAFDPSMFYRVDEYADDAIAGRRDGRYTPLDVAGWLDKLADDAERHLATARSQASEPDAPAFRRLAVDVTVQAGLGRFFAGKSRAGVAYSLHERTRDAQHLGDAVAAYRQARDVWAGIVEQTREVYRPDLTFGDLRSEHGHWADRLPAIEEDLANLERLHEAAKAEKKTPGKANLTIQRSARPAFTHRVPVEFVRGAEIGIDLVPSDASFDGHVVCHYRHVNQGADFETAEMRWNGARYQVSVPGSYTDSDFALMYYFIIYDAGGDAWIIPGLEESLASQPYHLLRQRIH